jgi:Helicase associated domain
MLALNNNNSHLPPPPPPEQDTIDPQTTTITTATNNNKNNNNNKLRCRIPSHQQAWEKQFHRLQAFKTVFSHVNIPHGEKCHASLYAWVKKQRLFWRQTLRGENPTCPLSQDDIARLESVGLTAGEETSKKGTSNSSNNNSSSKWHPSHQQAWLEKYYQLEQFKHTHGHLQVPFSNALDASLYSWLVMQKSQWRRERQGLKHRLHPEQLKMLVDVGLGSFQDGPATTTDASAGDAASAFTGSTHNIQAKQRMQAWMEKWNQLRDFMAVDGGRAPSHEEDTAHAASLFSWLKNQKYRWRKALHVAARKEGDNEDDAEGDADQEEGEEKQEEDVAAAAARLSKRGRPLCQEQMQLLIELGLGDSNGPAAGNSGTINSWDESYYGP